MAEKLVIPDARREPRDASGRFILFAFLLLVGSLSTVGLITWRLFPAAPNDTAITTTATKFPSPVLQTDPRHDLQVFEAAQMRQLTSYGWVDRSKGIVHVPIDRAMETVAKDGIPGWPAQAAAGAKAP